MVGKKKLLAPLATVMLSWPAFCQTYTITTVAGSGATQQANGAATPGAGGFNGDGGQATSALLNFPVGVVTDSAGILYIADSFNNRIRKVSNGVITTIAGVGPTAASSGWGAFNGDGGPATSASLNTPQSVAVDSAGNIYIDDNFNARIRQIMNGVLKTVAGNGVGGFSGDGGPAINAELAAASVVVDSAGNIYIADSTNNRIREVSDGVITTVAGSGAIYQVNGTLGSGPSGFGGDGGPATSALLSNPQSVAVDNVGNLFIADTDNNRIRKVSNGIITTVAGSTPVNVAGSFGGDGGPATSARLFQPQGVAVDSAGNIYIADTFNSRVRKVSNGVITTIAGNGLRSFGGDCGPATQAQLFYPWGIAVDSVGKVYVADPWNYRIRVLTPVLPPPAITAVVNAASFQNGPISPGEIVTIGGTGLGPSTPAGLTLDQAGKVATSLGGVQVLFSGAPAPLTYVSGTQINCVVPYETQGLTTVQVQVTSQGRTSKPFPLVSAGAVPALFTSNGTGGGPAAALNQDGSYNTPSNPAAKGSYVVLYLTGEGQTAPAGITGEVTTAPLNAPQTPQPVLPVAVLINGQLPLVAFYGEAPGLVSGVMQVNVQVPADAPSGNLLVQIAVGPSTTQAGVTISVQ